MERPTKHSTSRKIADSHLFLTHCTIQMPIIIKKLDSVFSLQTKGFNYKLLITAIGLLKITAIPIEYLRQIQGHALDPVFCRISEKLFGSLSKLYVEFV